MEKTSRPAKSLAALFAAVLIIHLASTAPFYALITQNTGTLAHIAVRLLRLALCLAFALLLRGRHGSLGPIERKRVRLFVLPALLVAALAQFTGLCSGFYTTVAYILGIYGPGETLLFPAVLLEQLVTFDLLYGVLLGSLILTLPPRPRREAA